jgi:hypothetical protein
VSRLQERILETGSLLRRDRALWGPSAYRGDPLVGLAALPRLHAALLDLSEAEVELGERHPERLELPEPFPTLLAEARRCEQVDRLPGQPWARGPRGRRVKGRKRDQIEAFAGAVLAWWPSGLEASVLDWCSGHGHLGRHLGERSGRPVTCLELDPELVRGALTLGGVEALQADALGPSGVAELRPGRAVVALHACGDLGSQLVLHGQDLEAIALAPCCYIRTTAGWNRRLSRTAPDLGLERKHVFLSTVGEHSLRERRQLLRRRQQAWRVALDLLLREQTGEDRHHPVPSCRKSTLTRLDFGEWARLLAARAGYELGPFDAASAERAGWERARQLRAVGLVRCIYTRCLELYLALDRAVALEEQGRTVQLGTFCQASVTPRNLLILAR